MCGIVGIATFGGTPSPVAAELKRMCDAILHRGPDDDGMQIVENVALGMRRLAIIDLAGGAQPISNEDGTVRVVFNGEIYNFRELRRELQRCGHRFQTESDTEVLVHGYEEYGDAFVERLNGMFAFALHDMRNKRLLVARDHLGIKPLFYSTPGNTLVWGSEIKALLATGRVERDLDVDSLGEFFAWEYVPGTGTLFKDIRKLEPGHMLVVDLKAGTIDDREYWDIPLQEEDHGPSYDEWADALEAKIDECVQRQLVADVPLGAFLSGGVDSSLVVAAMGQANTFSIGFDDPSYNELAYSQQVADHLGVAHTTEIIKPDVAGHFEHLMHFMDDPIGDFSIFPTYLVSKLARRQVTVSLSGDGGDELFAGYETYLANDRARLYARVPAFLRRGLIEPVVNFLPPQKQKKGFVNKAKRFVEGCEEPASLGHARWRIFLNEAMRANFFSKSVSSGMKRDAGAHIRKLYERARPLQPLNQSLYVDTRSYLVDNCLVKTDRMSMAVSLESRVPLLDTELVEMAFRIPAKHKLRGTETKAILKTVAARRIPASCVYRPKEGFSIPIKQWLGGQFRPWLDRATDKRRIEADGLFRYDTVAKMKSEHLAGSANHSHVLWSLIVFNTWKDMWLEGQ
ncbi:MAG TPA: asparagine synthase (glutamine-hydrolyzing) [Woeseiaceae bacterium]|nr:asparagine synthase (glutamine-hydrolyzing) [Woeseiaceae bacterium]